MKLQQFLKHIFSLTAWEMTPWEPYSVFHLLLCAAGIIAAALAAKWLAVSTARPKTVLFRCGLVLLLLELYKQGFLYFVELGEVYDWWYFPFQLCSIPMYLCLLFPCSGRFAETFSTFMQDYGLLGGFMALLVPDGLLHPYWALTLHGFFWHFLLIFAGLFSAFSGVSVKSRRGYLKTLPLFFTCCLIAFAINVASGPLSDADMFYISPYHPSSQPVFHQISLAAGILPGILIYLGATILGAFLIHEGIRKLFHSTK